MIPIRLNPDTIVTFSDEAGGAVAREARLLVAGSYPDKDLTVSEADLDALVTNFSGPLPVKVEHIDSPLDPLGIIQSVRRSGSGAAAELLGTIHFPPDMASFLSKRGAHKLSVGLLKEPVWRLLEASLTLTPHVPTATLLSDGERSELVQLRQQLRKQTVDTQIAELKASGRVIPATEALARQLLEADQAVITLSDGTSISAGEKFFEFLKSQPPLVHLSELAAVKLAGGAAGVAGADPDEDAFSEDDLEVMKRLGVRPEDVKKTMRADKGIQSRFRAAKRGNEQQGASS